ncbi:uncharacterized protein LOC144432358 isoform X1 [Styela clava]
MVKFGKNVCGQQWISGSLRTHSNAPRTLLRPRTRVGKHCSSTKMLKSPYYVTLQEARKFDFSNKKNFALGIYPTCDRFRLSKQSCPAMQAMEWWHSSFHRSDEMKMYSDVMINCECQTVWCIHDIFTIYEKNGKLYKGNVTVKTPCKCDCRKKFEGWIGKK